MNEATIATEAAIDSPAEDRFEALDDEERTLTERMTFIDSFGFSVFTRDAARCVARHASQEGILSVGAGDGYDSHVIAQAGVDVRAVDVEPDPDPWHPVEEADAIDLAGETERALYIAWPPRNFPLAEKALQAYEGDRVFYAGEPAECDPNNEGFHTRLAENWTQVETCPLPNWPGINDRLVVYERD